MKIVIVGASYTGIQLAKSLADEKSDVVLIDNSPEKVRLARNKIDCTVIQAASGVVRRRGARRVTCGSRFSG